MEQRRNAIVELVNREGSLSFVQLKEAFPSVSEMTLRTDLKALDQARRVVRVHGGVKSVEVVVGTDDQFGRRTARNASEKQIIAEKAAALLRPNTTVFLDSGSTATAVARCVPDEPMLIFTSGLTCAIELARLEKPKVSIPGGTLNRFSHSVCGVRGIQELDGVHFDLLLLGVTSYSPETGFACGVEEEALLKQTVLHRAEHVAVLLDSSKIDRRSRYRHFGRQTAAEIPFGVRERERKSAVKVRKPSLVLEQTGFLLGLKLSIRLVCRYGGGIFILPLANRNKNFYLYQKIRKTGHFLRNNRLIWYARRDSNPRPFGS